MSDFFLLRIFRGEDTVPRFLSIKTAIGGAVAFVVGMWSEVHPLVRLLIILMSLDIVAGVMSAFIRKVLSSQVSFRGMTKKALMLLLVGTGHLLTEAFHLQLDLGAACAGFFAVNELISIIENVDEAGVPIPSPLSSALAKLKIIADISDKPNK